MLTSLLVFMLSGVPAAAVVCDLLFCGDRTQPPLEETCHQQHGSTDPGQRMYASSLDCGHLVSTEVYVPAARELFPQVLLSIAPAGPLADAASIVARAAERAFAHGPPRTPHVPALLSLRI